jgi:hypothetical protein
MTTTVSGDSGGTAVTTTTLPTLQGQVLQIVNYTTGTYATGTGSIPIDNTIPQNTEGDEYLSLSITPKSATSKLVILVVLQLNVSAAQWTSVALFQDSTANALASGWNYIDLATAGSNVVICHYMTSGTTSATTFKVRAAGNSGITIGINGQAGIAARFGGTLSSSITITEVVP